MPKARCMGWCSIWVHCRLLLAVAEVMLHLPHLVEVEPGLMLACSRDRAKDYCTEKKEQSKNMFSHYHHSIA